MVFFNNENIVIGNFPNGEKQYLKIKRDKNGELPLLLTRGKQNLRVIYRDNSDLFDALLYKKYLDDLMISTILHIYFIPYGQSDREFDSAIFTFKYFAKLINEAGFKEVHIYDPHSPVIAGCIDRCIIHSGFSDDMYKDYDLFFYTDNGAAKKYSEIYDHPYRFGNKKCNLDTGEIICYEVIADKKDIEGKKILIVDDICMGGRTFKEAAKALLDMGAAQVDLWITHLMPQAEDFYKNHKDFGITNFYSYNTLRMPWFQFR